MLFNKLFFLNQTPVPPTPTPRLPDAYQEVEYLGFTDCQYIDTGVIPTNHSTEIKVEPSIKSYSYINTILGTLRSYPYIYYSICIYQEKYYYGFNGSEGNGGSYSEVGSHIIKYNYGNNNEISVDGNVYSTGVECKCEGYNLLIGKRNTEPYTGKVMYCSIIDKNTNELVRNFVPCYRKSDDVAGMYDTVNNVFYLNAGTGTFQVGPDVN